MENSSNREAEGNLSWWLQCILTCLTAASATAIVVISWMSCCRKQSGGRKQSQQQLDDDDDEEDSEPACGPRRRISNGRFMVKPRGFMNVSTKKN
ncbi:hypothetical protein LINPERHAP2_LOCUS29603 [Linum perenne]